MYYSPAESIHTCPSTLHNTVRIMSTLSPCDLLHISRYIGCYCNIESAWRRSYRRSSCLIRYGPLPRSLQYHCNVFSYLRNVGKYISGRAPSSYSASALSRAVVRAVQQPTRRRNLVRQGLVQSDWCLVQYPGEWFPRAACLDRATAGLASLLLIRACIWMARIKAACFYKSSSRIGWATHCHMARCPRLRLSTLVIT